MVLRTIYLPPDVDQALKSAAIRGSRSKGDLIRELIKTGLEAKRKEAGSYFAEPSGNRQPVRPAAVTRTIVGKAKSPKPRAKPKKAALD
ncbi:CopG family transcriptional regulator [Sphingobium sp. UBA5915]|uniref:ribbon-helix-helix domain-containing protein n=1 Tax=Sphingobium sp. UBA5915 TaxID=1947530 RepID=UPI0025E38832|nr:CopG family transcriptional regulator [Sphingobium sp. UBA5915]